MTFRYARTHSLLPVALRTPTIGCEFRGYADL